MATKKCSTWNIFKLFSKVIIYNQKNFFFSSFTCFRTYKPIIIINIKPPKYKAKDRNCREGKNIAKITARMSKIYPPNETKGAHFPNCALKTLIFYGLVSHIMLKPFFRKGYP